ncbi:hypothetical protein ACOME3_004163 [Neoechinorhynchus agilis]
MFTSNGNEIFEMVKSLDKSVCISFIHHGSNLIDKYKVAEYIIELINQNERSYGEEFAPLYNKYFLNCLKLTLETKELHSATLIPFLFEALKFYQKSTDEILGYICDHANKVKIIQLRGHVNELPIAYSCLAYQSSIDCSEFILEALKLLKQNNQRCRNMALSAICVAFILLYESKGILIKQKVGSLFEKGTTFDWTIRIVKKPSKQVFSQALTSECLVRESRKSEIYKDCVFSHDNGNFSDKELQELMDNAVNRALEESNHRNEFLTEMVTLLELVSKLKLSGFIVSNHHTNLIRNAAIKTFTSTNIFIDDFDTYSRLAIIDAHESDVNNGENVLNMQPIGTNHRSIDLLLDSITSNEENLLLISQRMSLLTPLLRGNNFEFNYHVISQTISCLWSRIKDRQIIYPIPSVLAHSLIEICFCFNAIDPSRTFIGEENSMLYEILVQLYLSNENYPDYIYISVEGEIENMNCFLNRKSLCSTEIESIFLDIINRLSSAYISFRTLNLLYQLLRHPCITLRLIANIVEMLGKCINSQDKNVRIETERILSLVDQLDIIRTNINGVAIVKELISKGIMGIEKPGDYCRNTVESISTDYLFQFGSDEISSNIAISTMIPGMEIDACIIERTSLKTFGSNPMQALKAFLPLIRNTSLKKSPCSECVIFHGVKVLLRLTLELSSPCSFFYAIIFKLIHINPAAFIDNWNWKQLIKLPTNIMTKLANDEIQQLAHLAASSYLCLVHYAPLKYQAHLSEAFNLLWKHFVQKGQSQYNSLMESAEMSVNDFLNRRTFNILPEIDYEQLQKSLKGPCLGIDKVLVYIQHLSRSSQTYISQIRLNELYILLLSCAPTNMLSTSSMGIIFLKETPFALFSRSSGFFDLTSFSTRLYSALMRNGQLSHCFVDIVTDIFNQSDFGSKVAKSHLTCSIDDSLDNTIVYLLNEYKIKGAQIYTNLINTNEYLNEEIKYFLYSILLYRIYVGAENFDKTETNHRLLKAVNESKSSEFSPKLLVSAIALLINNRLEYIKGMFKDSAEFLLEVSRLCLSSLNDPELALYISSLIPTPSSSLKNSISLESFIRLDRTDNVLAFEYRLNSMTADDNVAFLAYCDLWVDMVSYTETIESGIIGLQSVALENIGVSRSALKDDHNINLLSEPFHTLGRWSIESRNEVKENVVCLLDQEVNGALVDKLIKDQPNRGESLSAIAQVISVYHFLKYNLIGESNDYCTQEYYWFKGNRTALNHFAYTNELKSIIKAKDVSTMCDSNLFRTLESTFNVLLNETRNVYEAERFIRDLRRLKLNPCWISVFDAETRWLKGFKSGAMGLLKAILDNESFARGDWFVRSVKCLVKWNSDVCTEPNSVVIDYLKKAMDISIPSDDTYSTSNVSRLSLDLAQMLHRVYLEIDSQVRSKRFEKKVRMTAINANQSAKVKQNSESCSVRAYKWFSGSLEEDRNHIASVLKERECVLESCIDSFITAISNTSSGQSNAAIHQLYSLLVT